MPEQSPRIEVGNIIESDKRAEKERAWKSRLKELDHITDGLGEGIDENIKEVVAAFSVNGLNTLQSCEGHGKPYRSTPWVWIEAPDEPDIKYIREKEVLDEVAERYGMPNEDKAWEENEVAWMEASKLLEQNGKTPEFKAWQSENKRLRKITEELLTEFYVGHSADPATRIILQDEGGFDAFKAHNDGEDYDLTEELDEKQKNGLEKRLLKYREEMESFGKFLKEKYFSG
ncbi:MAG: hypothetical protein UW30_C0001G0031 [Candidatus Giovannonibacteria bacterium GW2011_GWA2_44_13b]|uniref:Uncharacterized protein n=2 Tax=Candidatus Giovannoniibacteriota TaxID=1752738 RepID=A0A0G1H4G6_9BACT|nr:MAG: hypothetical protein UW30_C0001G0031 [Candidatus Giovannonibacteria bacterium GW2011_GWA2_44_13b]OGF83216.1 MAG: hypothetical protein A2924_02780 [Candidatus Giovannonibacteria bacterium RIFCSPLOWO2_01_FULL_44_16]